MGTNEWAVVTGAGSGIGRACATMLAGRGLGVVCAGRTADKLDRVVAEITAAGGRAVAVAADCGSELGIDAVTAASVEAAGTEPAIAAVVHAAGRDISKSFSSTTRDDLDEMLATDLYGPFFLTQRLLPQLRAGAGVVFVGSVSARRGRDFHAGYGASKAALIGLTVNLAVELAPAVRVNLVSPGGTRTAMLRDYVQASTAHLDDDAKARVAIADAARMPLGRVAEPAEVAASIVHLALDATATTGIDLAVDVGYTAS